MKIELKGEIKEKSFGDNDDALFIGDMDEPIAKHVSELMSQHGNLLTVKYWTSKRPVNEIKDAFTHKLFGGISDAEYEDAYSDITGYLWTDEDLNIGGHDLLSELRSHLGENCILEIDFSQPTKELG